MREDELRDAIESEIWEAVNSAGLDPDTQKGKDIIAFRSEDILDTIHQYVTKKQIEELKIKDRIAELEKQLEGEGGNDE